MRRYVIATFLSLGLIWAAHAQDNRTVIDGAGRQVEIPLRVTRLVAAGPPASVIVFSLAPDTLIGWTSAFRPAERPFIAPRYADLPELGRLTGRANTANIETILAARPDVIVDYGSVTPTYVSLADRVQAQTRVPYILVDGAFDKMEEAYRLLGEILGREREAAAYAGYVRETLKDIDAIVAAVPAQARPRVYYARNPNGLQTGRGQSINVESLARVGAHNVADSLGAGGLVNVSMEQVLAWNPDVIVTTDSNFFQTLFNDPLWQRIAAVQTRRVYLAPGVPFGWIDFPPSVNRLIGLRWLTSVLYPSIPQPDLRAQISAFYARFYHQTPSAAQLDDLLGQAAAAGRGAPR